MDIRSTTTEESALRVAAQTLCPHATDAIENLIETRALVDAAIAIFREVLPDCGFKLVMPPLSSGNETRQAYASVWRRGDAQSIAHRAVTPAMALLRATHAESRKRRNADALADCTVCSGLGWFIRRAGVKQLCNHRTQRGARTRSGEVCSTSPAKSRDDQGT